MTYVAGCDPRIMGIGPVPAIRNMLKATGKILEDIDLIEVYLAQCDVRQLNVPRRLRVMLALHQAVQSTRLSPRLKFCHLLK